MIPDEQELAPTERRAAPQITQFPTGPRKGILDGSDRIGLAPVAP
jgi:hypothetical protein